MSAIASVEAERFAVPLAEVLTDAKHGDHTHFELVTATVTLADGRPAPATPTPAGAGGRPSTR